MYSYEENVDPVDKYQRSVRGNNVHLLFFMIVLMLNRRWFEIILKHAKGVGVSMDLYKQKIIFILISKRYFPYFY